MVGNATATTIESSMTNDEISEMTSNCRRAPAPPAGWEPACMEDSLTGDDAHLPAPRQRLNNIG
jgi:hypothetical protein